MDKKVYDNEKWWQDNGLQWVKEIEKRRNTQPLYGVQEVILAEYFSGIPNDSKVLEFGAGFGRHAKYLSELNNIEYYAVDQSPTMLKAFNAYTQNSLSEDRYILIEPRQRLPFPDNYFDVVFTVSVLIHINPEHINLIIDELKRVSKHVILHFENKLTKTSELQFKDHNGCWKHAVQNLYKNVDVVDDISDEQTLYVSYLSDDLNYKFKVNPVVRGRLHLLDENLGEGLRKAEGEIGWRQKQLEKDEDEIRKLNGEIGWRQKQLEKDEDEIRKLNGEVGWRQKQLEKDEDEIRKLNGEVGWRQKQLEIDEEQINNIQKEKNLLITKLNEADVKNNALQSSIQAVNNELNAIYSSNSWKMVQKLKNNKFSHYAGKSIISLFRGIKGENKQEIIYAEDNVKKDVDVLASNFISQLKSGKGLLAITHKNWHGVKNSTKELFGDYIIETEELSSHNQVVAIGDEILKSGVQKIVFSGFAAGWNSLCSYIKKNNSNIKIIIFWHGNTTHMYEDYSWVRYQEILKLYEDRHIDKIAFAKESMHLLYKKKGFNTCFLKNHVKKENIIFEDKIAERNVENGIRIGIYSSGGTWNKNAYTQIAAASLFNNATVSMVPYNERMHTFATQLGLKVEGCKGNLTREQLLNELHKNDINLYVTFSECAPLIPLESLNCGTVCLTGNNHHYFKGTKLEDMLIVNGADNTIEIYNKAVEALKNREEIIAIYSEWYKKNEKEAIECLKDL